MNYILKLGNNLPQLVWLFQTNKNNSRIDNFKLFEPRNNQHFHKKKQVGNSGINANFVFSYIYSFLHYFDLKILVNVKLEKKNYFSKLQIIVFFFQF